MTKIIDWLRADPRVPPSRVATIGKIERDFIREINTAKEQRTKSSDPHSNYEINATKNRLTLTENCKL